MDDFAWERRDWTPIDAIAVDAAGVVWIAGQGGIARFIEGDWQHLPGTNDLPYVFRAITIDANGDVYCTGGRHVAAYVGGRWRVVEAPDHLLPEEGWLKAIHVGPAGIRVGSGTGQLLRFCPADWV